MCGSIFHSENDSFATTQLSKKAPMISVSNPRHVLVHAGCVLQAYSAGNFSKENFQVRILFWGGVVIIRLKAISVQSIEIGLTGTELGKSSRRKIG